MPLHCTFIRMIIMVRYIILDLERKKEKKKEKKLSEHMKSHVGQKKISCLKVLCL